MANIVVIVSGGVVQNVMSDDKEIHDVTVVDYDVQGSDEVKYKFFGDEADVYAMSTQNDSPDLKTILDTINSTDLENK